MIVEITSNVEMNDRHPNVITRATSLMERDGSSSRSSSSLSTDVKEVLSSIKLEFNLLSILFGTAEPLSFRLLANLLEWLRRNEIYRH